MILKIYLFLWIVSAMQPISRSFRVFRSQLCTPQLQAVRSLSARPIVHVESDKAHLFLSGNPLLFNGAVKKVQGDPQPGDEVDVGGINNTIIARGLYNPHSQYRVRIIATAQDPCFSLPLEKLVGKRIKQAFKMRNSINLPSESTSAYRLVNGEGDQLSGLMIDVFDKLVVIQSSALWVEKHRNKIEKAVHRALENRILGHKIIWKLANERLKQDGYILDKNTEKDDTQELSDKEHTMLIKENDVCYQVSPLLDQKTGFYCDQRDNRLLIRSLSNKKSVLDLYCYTGGFALNALYGNASSVVAIDSSQRALETAQTNLQLNHQLDDKKLTFIEDDCVKAMETLFTEKKTFDIIICDPPKLAPNRAALSKAKNKYQKINALAMSLINEEGGLLLTCSCSGAMTQSNEFMKVLLQASVIAKRTIKVLSVHSAARDHTVLAALPEGHYLTAVLLYVM